MRDSSTVAGSLLELALLIVASFLWGADMARLLGSDVGLLLFLVPCGAVGGWFASRKARRLFP